MTKKDKLKKKFLKVPTLEQARDNTMLNIESGIYEISKQNKRILKSVRKIDLDIKKTNKK
ncbi:unnamed protein product [marine sediment metagenome]|uniref:Uncharacterized protein n=1 Tax=marine sediment metagenome TaxID=412755 RepID=X0SR58_9ZZZZ